MPLDNYTWEKSARRRRVALTINSRGELIVKSPLYTSKRAIEAFIHLKKSWILKQQLKQQERIHPELPIFGAKGVLVLYGEKIPFVCEDRSPSKLHEHDGCITIDAKSEALFKKVLTQWYREKSSRAVNFYLDKYRPKISKQPQSIQYKRVKSKWGSCDHKNNLMFNTLLAQHQWEHIEYIVVHELSHIQEKHHRTTFWEHGEKLLPGFKKLHKDMIQ